MLKFFGRDRRNAVSANNLRERKIPSMVSRREAAFFTESAARYVGREGAIVDLGCWLGSTSVALARGTLIPGREREDRNEMVFGFDVFRWEAWMPAHIPYCLYQAGDSFLPEARRVIRDFGGGAVELVHADLEVYEWAGGPIKILLVDAMKTPGLAARIPRSFFSSLIAGGLLIHQDFKHYHTTWIHLLQYRLREYFQLYQSVVNTQTVAFEVMKPVGKEAIDRATDFATMGDEEIDASFRHSLALVGSEDGANIAAAHIMHYAHLGRKARAFETLETYRSFGTDTGEFPLVMKHLNQLS